jgi:hypothetical protein
MTISSRCFRSGLTRSASPFSGTVRLIRRTAQSIRAPNAPSILPRGHIHTIAWIGLVVAYFAVAAKPGAPRSDSKMARLCDVIVLLLLPLPLSSWFVPYHALVMLPAFVLILANLADEAAPRHVRVLAAIAAIGCVLIHMTIRDWELRAGIYLADFIMVVLTLGAIRLSLTRARSGLASSSGGRSRNASNEKPCNGQTSQCLSSAGR